MTQNAIQLVDNENSCSDERNARRVTRARQIAMLRPSMVSIVNVMNRIIADNGKELVTLESFLHELSRCVTMGQITIEDLIQQKPSSKNDTTSPTLNIATFSRSGTLAKILKPFVEKRLCTVVCSQSTPGDEGELMAKDLQSPWIPDDEMHRLLNGEKNKERILDLVLIGSDCVQPQTESMVNKVGTKKLCEIPVFCCADTWKVWNDIFPPPTEEDLFEFVPLKLVTELLVS